ncbi:TlpA family protein disulfide reductase [Sphingobacterium faecale]|uniref:TlpA family protein disulfide reductase n=1 Tax=Sphingobacterium faecale TaxID=2803775 RepID=A0ABS1R9P9_9SPHI|nr:TlpA disulfide reductase family protein [Sphingobacterium faecale]MBL1411437.1 TlpA family protein disulfide reductase [Sphingobacterium faecale]
MKKFIYLMIAIAGMTLPAMAQVKTYTIQSSVSGLEGDSFTLTIWNGQTQSVIKRAIPYVDGQLYYQDTTSVPLLVRISVLNNGLSKPGKGGTYPVKSQHIWLVAMPGSKVELKGHFSDFSEVFPYGDLENDILRELTQSYFPLLNAVVNISVELARDDHGLSDAAIKVKKEEQAILQQRADAQLMAFLEKQVSSIAGLYFLNDSYLRKRVSNDQLVALVNKVTSDYHTNQFYRSLQQRAEGAAYDVGKQIFEIKSSSTPDGTLFNTNVWKGKFYLIDFWGSWCVPCINDVPHLKEMKQALGDRVEILGIASDKEERWRKAIEQHQLNWQHVLIGAGDNDFASRLNVTGYPTKILVDPNGEIVYRSTGGGKTSFQTMVDIINQWK